MLCVLQSMEPDREVYYMKKKDMKNDDMEFRDDRGTSLYMMDPENPVNRRDMRAAPYVHRTLQKKTQSTVKLPTVAVIRAAAPRRS